MLADSDEQQLGSLDHTKAICLLNQVRTRIPVPGHLLGVWGLLLCPADWSRPAHCSEVE